MSVRIGIARLGRPILIDLVRTVGRQMGKKKTGPDMEFVHPNICGAKSNELKTAASIEHYLKIVHTFLKLRILFDKREPNLKFLNIF